MLKTSCKSLILLTLVSCYVIQVTSRNVGDSVNPFDIDVGGGAAVVNPSASNVGNAGSSGAAEVPLAPQYVNEDADYEFIDTGEEEEESNPQPGSGFAPASLSASAGCFYRGRLYRPGQIVGIGTWRDICVLRFCSRATGKVVAVRCSSARINASGRRGRCQYQGAYYNDGSVIRVYNACYKVKCYNGKVVEWRDETCAGPRQPPYATYTTTTPAPYRCYANRRYYEIGEKISTDRENDWCLGLVCTSTGPAFWKEHCPTTPSTPHDTTCSHQGNTYGEGDKVFSADPCMDIICRSGELVEYPLPSCNGGGSGGNSCSYNGRTYNPGQSWTNVDDPCIEYWCSYGKALETRKPNCPQVCQYEQQTYQHGVSIPYNDRCVKLTCHYGVVQRTQVPNCPQPCNYQGQQYDHGTQMPYDDRCVQLTCHYGEVQRTQVPNCPQACSYQGQQYDHGTQMPYEDRCVQLTCHYGEVQRTQVPNCPQACSYQGQQYDHGSQMPYDDRCVQLTCYYGEVQRTQVPNCPQACSYQGQQYDHGSQMPHADRCVQLTCHYGEVQRSQVPNCPQSCLYQGQQYDHGSQMPYDDRCVQLTCYYGEVQRTQVPNCPQACSYQGQQYDHGIQMPHEDRCVQLTCHYGEVQRSQVPNCPQSCSYLNNQYQHGADIPSDDRCVIVNCHYGTIEVNRIPGCTTGCYHNNQQYDEGSEITGTECQISICRNGQFVTEAVEGCSLTPSYCLHQGIRYSEGQKVPSQESCVELVCHDGLIARHETPQCTPTLVCEHEGKGYEAGADIPSTSDTCFQLTCGPDGEVIHTVLPFCRPTIPDPTGCYYEGEIYASGQTVPSGDRCVQIYCTESFELERRDVAGCTDTPVPDQPRCYHHGVYYLPNDEIMRVDCNVVVCSANGNVKERVEDGCTVQTPETGSGCEYNGKSYSLGQNVEKRREGTRCYYSVCGYDGKLYGWTESNCDNYGETENPLRPQPSQPGAGLPCNHLPPGRYADPVSCAHFWVCQEPPRMTCPQNYYWSELYKQCRPSSQVSCQTTPGQAFTCENKMAGGMYGDPQDCTKYYMCPINQLMQCPRGTLFDSSNEVCTHTNEVSCDATNYTQL